MNKWYIGQKVCDKRTGNGIIDDIVLTDEFPIKVEFFGHYETYTIDGMEYTGDDAQSLFPRFDKKGTPEARRIVAMLAREMLSIARLPSTMDDTFSVNNFELGYLSGLKTAYDNAKSMLGE